MVSLLMDFYALSLPLPHFQRPSMTKVRWRYRITNKQVKFCYKIAFEDL